MIDPRILEALTAAGATAEMIVAAIKVDAQIQEERAAERRAQAAERQRRHRMSRDVTQEARDMMLFDVTPPPPKESSPQTPFKEITPTPSSLRSGNGCAPEDRFEEFWSAYPKREGENPKKPAQQKFVAAVKRGENPEAIIAGARRLASQHPERSRFVPQAVTWLNQERWRPEDSTGPPAEPQRFRTVEELLAERRNGGSQAVSGR